MELPDLEAAKAEAAHGLADLARDVLPGVEVRGELVVDVRDASRVLLMRTTLRREVH